MRKGKLLTTLAVLVLVGAACSGDSDQTPATDADDEITATDAEETSPAEEALGDVPTEEDLAGLWLLDEPWDTESPRTDHMWRFTPDGTWLSAWTERFGTTAAPPNRGPYELSGDTLSATNTEGDGCPTNASWVWRVGVSGDGKLRAEFIESSTDCTMPLGTVWSFTRISPQSPASEAITTEIATDAGEPVTSPRQVGGLWRLEGTGQLVLIDIDDGTYQIDDAGQIGADPNDTGSLEVDEDGTITFISGPESRDCSAGDRMTWTRTERLSATVDHAVVQDAFVLSTVASEDTCRDLEGALNWIRMVDSQVAFNRGDW
jgi:hypothetical protein